MIFLALSTLACLILIGTTIHAFKKLKTGKVKASDSDIGEANRLGIFAILAFCNIALLTDNTNAGGSFVDGHGDSCSYLNQFVTSVAFPSALIMALVIIGKYSNPTQNTFVWTAILFLSTIILYLFGTLQGFRCSSLATKEDLGGGILYGNMYNSIIFFLGMAIMFTWPQAQEQHGFIVYMSRYWMFLTAVVAAAIFIPGALSWTSLVYADCLVWQEVKRSVMTKITLTKKGSVNPQMQHPAIGSFIGSLFA